MMPPVYGRLVSFCIFPFISTQREHTFFHNIIRGEYMEQNLFYMTENSEFSQIKNRTRCIILPESMVYGKLYSSVFEFLIRGGRS